MSEAVTTGGIGRVPGIWLDWTGLVLSCLVRTSTYCTVSCLIYTCSLDNDNTATTTTTIYGWE